MSTFRHQRLKILTADEGVLRLAGDLDLTTADALRERLRTLEREDLVLDLSGVCFMDSSGLAALLDARATAHRHGASLRVRGSDGQTLELLKRTGVFALLNGASWRSETSRRQGGLDAM